MLRLGLTAFGGPAAHLAMARAEVVDRRKWVTPQRFLDLIGASSLLPGPTSTQVCLQLGMERGGWAGLWTAGCCFISPAVLLTLLLAWLYMRWGTTPAAGGLLYGAKPAVAAVILGAVWQFGRSAGKTLPLALLGVLTGVLYLAWGHELALLLGCGLLSALTRAGAPRVRLQTLAWLSVAGGVTPLVAQTIRPRPDAVFFYFLKIGSVLFGGGYVLIAFVRQDLVHTLRWLTDRQLLDAIAAGQFTPGPLFSTATFIGYVIGGWRGAVAASAGIFLPSFALVGSTHHWVRKLRATPVAAAFLDGVNVGSVGLMAGVLVQLMAASLPDLTAWVLFFLAAAAAFRFRCNSAWLVLAGAAVGSALHRG